MYKIPEDTKEFYEENPEKLEQRIFLSIQLLEDYLKDHGRMDIAKPCFERWGKAWEVARSFWVFPDEKDMKKMVDEEYANL